LLKIIKKAFVDLKGRKYHIICSWILLICFVAGQYMVYAHQHNVVNGTGRFYIVSKNIPRQTLKEKCALCDVMHHNSMATTAQVYLKPATVAGHVFKSETYNCVSIRLILTGGRAPPTAKYTV
jgi:hypothetical protein